MPTVVITGANRGLGLELTGQYLEKGWRVIAVSRNSSPGLDGLGRFETLECYHLNLTDDEALVDLASGLKDRCIDVLLNNAGTMGRHNFAELGLKAGQFGSFNRQEWHEVFDINVCTPMLLAELFVNHVAASDNGRIVTVSSIVGSMSLNTVGSMYAYRASKAAVNSVMKSMAINLAPRGIIAVALHPGFARTEMSGPLAEIEPADSATGMIRVIDALTTEDAGKVISWDGKFLPW